MGSASPTDLRAINGLQCDVAVVGAGILGLAVARELQLRRPAARVVVLERERLVAVHQTGRNSGVIHAGLITVPVRSKPSFAAAALMPSTTTATGTAYRAPMRQARHCSHPG